MCNRKIHTCASNPEKSYIEKYQKHAPSNVSYCVKSTSTNHKSKTVIYRGSKAANVFVQKLRERALKIKKIYRNEFKLNH
jgi:hypothetical protein